jgi:hypothetical protein
MLSWLSAANTMMEEALSRGEERLGDTLRYLYLWLRISS